MRQHLPHLCPTPEEYAPQAATLTKRHWLAVTALADSDALPRCNMHLATCICPAVCRFWLVEREELQTDLQVTQQRMPGRKIIGRLRSAIAMART